MSVHTYGILRIHTACVLFLYALVHVCVCMRSRVYTRVYVKEIQALHQRERERERKKIDKEKVGPRRILKFLGGVGA